MASESPRTVNGFVVFIGSGAAFVGVALVAILLLSANRSSGPTLEDQRAKGRSEVAARLEKEAHEKLNSAGWVDKEKGLVRAPISDVLPLVAAELKAKKPAPSQVKVDPPLPMPVIDPNATEPPPPALTAAPQGADTIRFTAPVAPEVAPAPAAAPAAPAAAPAPASPAPAAPEKLTPLPTAPMPVPAPAPANPPALAPAPAPATPTTPPPATTPPAPAAPTPAAPPVAPPAAPAPVPPAPAPATPPAAIPPASAPSVPPAPVPASPAPQPTSPPSAAPPAPAPSPAAPEASAPQPLINQTENSESTK